MLWEFSSALATKTFMCECADNNTRASRKTTYVLWNQEPGSGMGPPYRKRVAVVRIAAIGARPEVRFVATAVYGIGGRTVDLGRYADEHLWMG